MKVPLFLRRLVVQRFILFIWGVVVIFGFSILLKYSNTPGESAISTIAWPKTSLLTKDANRSSLAIFVHPQCPCSKATIGELERLVPHIYNQTNINVVFYKPQSKTESWVKGSLWQKAASIPHVNMIIDNEGSEAIKFGAKTSGQTFLFSQDEKLVFSGGITPSRGHMGDSLGRAAILSFVLDGNTKISSAPVFGCSLVRPERKISSSNDE